MAWWWGWLLAVVGPCWVGVGVLMLLARRAPHDTDLWPGGDRSWET